MNYTEQAEKIEQEVYGPMAAMRNAQVPGSNLYMHYQDRITARTGVALALKVSIPDLEAADYRVRSAASRLADVEETADAEMDRWWKLIKTSAAVGAVGVIVPALFPLSGWVPTIGVLALVGAAAALYVAIRNRPQHMAAIEQATAAVAAARDERAAMEKRIERGLPAIPAAVPVTDHTPNGWPHLAVDNTNAPAV